MRMSRKNAPRKRGVFCFCPIAAFAIRGFGVWNGSSLFLKDMIGTVERHQAEIVSENRRKSDFEL